MTRLKARALNSGKERANALFLFDYGYLIETYKQVSIFHGGLGGMNLAGGENGFGYVLEALARRGDDAEMAALIAS